MDVVNVDVAQHLPVLLRFISPAHYTTTRVPLGYVQDMHQLHRPRGWGDHSS